MLIGPSVGTVVLLVYFQQYHDGVGRLQGHITFQVGTAILNYLATYTSTQSFRRCPICLCCLPKFDVRSSHTLILPSSAVS